MSALAIQQFRETYRSKYPKKYSGMLHLLITNLICLSLIIWAILWISHLQWIELSIVPLTFVIANLLEYSAHRFFMHQRNPLFVAAFDRHMNHHKFFVHDAMFGATASDYRITLFPVSLILAITCFFIIPVAGLLYFFALTNVAALFVLTAAFYLLNYEWLHLLYHLPENHWTSSNLFRKLRKHHQNHHQPKQMQKYNFNISYPLIDYLVATNYQEPDYYLNEQGLMVFTASYHLKRGYCCKSGCKHCPY